MRRPTVLLLLLAALCAPALAGAQSLEDYDYENLAFRGLGLDFGAVWPARVQRTWAIGVRADLGYLGPNVRIVPGITYWSSALREGQVTELRQNILRLCREPESDCVQDFGEIRVSDLVLDVDGHYTFPAASGLLPYVGGGVGIHLLNGQGDLIDDTFIESLLDAIAPGVNLIAGLEVPLGSLSLFTEARGVLASDVQYAGIRVGGTWAFPSIPGAVRGR